MARKSNELMNASAALRVLVDSVGLKWLDALSDEHDGLGHIHDLWNMMYEDMEAIVCLEKYIADNEDDVTGSDFRPVPGFEKYGSGHDAD